MHIYVTMNVTIFQVILKNQLMKSNLYPKPTFGGVTGLCFGSHNIYSYF